MDERLQPFTIADDFEHILCSHSSELAPMSESKIGFIGLGDMGEPMATRLLDAGFTLSSCAHRRRQAIETLKEKGPD